MRLWKVAEGYIIEATAEHQARLFDRFQSGLAAVGKAEGKAIRRAWLGIKPINSGVRQQDEIHSGSWTLDECQSAVRAYPKSQRFRENLCAVRAGDLREARASL